MDNNKTPVFTAGAFIVVLGIVLAGIKIYAGWNGVPVQGTIASTQQLSRTDSAGAKTYYEATVTYITEQGTTAIGILTYYENNLKVDDKVDIVYRKDNVSRIYRAGSAWWYVLCAGVVGLGILVMYVSMKMKSERWD
jgi:hypothetical protein